LRLYDIDAQGIRIGQMLPDREGLLGGRPAAKLAAPRPTAADHNGG
jgi:circadian clock protein KaiC